MFAVTGQPDWRVGVARQKITPPPGVELAGLGYYLERTWERISNDLTATALVISEKEGNDLAIVALDLMYNDERLAQRIRSLVAEQIGPAAVCVNCSHTHNAPTAGLIRGCGERNEPYLAVVAERAAAAVAEAWRARQPARLYVGAGELHDMTFNRAQSDGLVDTRMSVLRADTFAGRPLAVAINFHSHCTAHMELDLRAVGRDWPGEVVDQLERDLPGVTALYLQGTCGDVNFRREFNGTEKRFEPARAVTKVALSAYERARPITAPGLVAVSRLTTLPVRPWTRQEIMPQREEGLYRLQSGDTNGWLKGLGRACVNQPERLPLRYGGSVDKTVAALARFAVEWTTDALPRLESKTTGLNTEVQAFRIGDVWFAAHAAELFTTFGLKLREAWANRDLFVLGYANGSIGYLPDAAEIERRGYAAIQSPKCTGQFPFTTESGPALVEALVAALETTA